MILIYKFKNMIKFNRFVHSENYLFFVILLVVSCYYVYVIIDAPNTYDYGDGIQHYLMSRYSWKHPELLSGLVGQTVTHLIKRSICTVLYCFSPIYFSVLNSGLTEVLFSFIMILVLFS